MSFAFYVSSMLEDIKMITALISNISCCTACLWWSQAFIRHVGYLTCWPLSSTLLLGTCHAHCWPVLYGIHLQLGSCWVCMDFTKLTESDIKMVSGMRNLNLIDTIDATNIELLVKSEW